VNYNLAGIDENVIDEEGNVVDLSKESSYGIRGKIGAAIADNVALYGIIGYQKTEFELTVTDEESRSDTNDHTGVVYGIGATYAIAPNVLLTAEATQTDLGDETYFQESDIQADGTQLGIGLAYRFDI
jgi:outer membrane immunogenic protein